MGISVPAPCLVFGEHGDSCALALLRTSTWFCLCRQKEQSKVLVTLEGTGALILHQSHFGLAGIMAREDTGNAIY